MLKVSSKLLHVVEDLLEILLNHRQDPRELYVTHARHYVVGDGVILVANEYGEFDVKALHHGGGFTSDSRLLAEPDLPVGQQPLHEEVETYQKVHDVIMSSLTELGWECLIRASPNRLTCEAPSKERDL